MMLTDKENIDIGRVTRENRLRNADLRLRIKSQKTQAK